MNKDIRAQFDKLVARKIPAKQFNLLLEENATRAEYALTKQNEFTPMLEVHYVDGLSDEELKIALMIVGVSFSDADEKRKLMMGMGAKLASKGHFPMAVFLMSEAWYRTAETEEEKEEMKSRLVSSYDDKKECVVVAGTTADRRDNFAIIPFSRDKNNKIIIDKDGIEVQKYVKDSEDRAQNNLNYFFFKGCAMAMK